MLTDLQGIDLESHLHPYTNFADIAERGPLIMNDAQGVRVRDLKGREYIDAMSGLWCCDVGYGRLEIAEAIAEQARPARVFPLVFRYGDRADDPSSRSSQAAHALVHGASFLWAIGFRRKRHSDQARVALQPSPG